MDLSPSMKLMYWGLQDLLFHMLLTTSSYFAFQHILSQNNWTFVLLIWRYRVFSCSKVRKLNLKSFRYEITVKFLNLRIISLRQRILWPLTFLSPLVRRSVERVRSNQLDAATVCSSDSWEPNSLLRSASLQFHSRTCVNRDNSKTMVEVF